MASQEHGFGPWSGAGVPTDPEPQMQADIDQHAAAVTGASATGSGGEVRHQARCFRQGYNYRKTNL